MTEETPSIARLRTLAVAVLAGLIACVISSEGWAQLKTPKGKTPKGNTIKETGQAGGQPQNLTLPSSSSFTLPETPSITFHGIPDELRNGGLGGDPPDESAGRSIPPMDLNDFFDYTDDILVSEIIAEYGTKTLIIQFHPDGRIRIQAMRDLLETTYKKLLRTTAAKAVEVIIAAKADTERQLAEIEDSWLSPFYWQTKDDLRRNIEEIRRGEDEAKRLERQGRDRAWAHAQSWNPKQGWSTHGIVKIRTGTAFRQLQHISINGWGGF